MPPGRVGENLNPDLTRYAGELIGAVLLFSAHLFEGTAQIVLFA